MLADVEDVGPTLSKCLQMLVFVGFVPAKYLVWNLNVAWIFENTSLKKHVFIICVTCVAF